jgi:hypothetical protein
MLQPDFDPAPVEVRIFLIHYVSKCGARTFRERATVVAEKVDGAGRHVRQIELCEPHCKIVIEREQAPRTRDFGQATRIDRMRTKSNRCARCGKPGRKRATLIRSARSSTSCCATSAIAR